MNNLNLSNVDPITQFKFLTAVEKNIWKGANQEQYPTKSVALAALSKVEQATNKAADEAARYKRVAIGTGVGAILSLVGAVAAVALGILFPPLAIPLFIVAVVLGTAFLALGSTAVAHAVKHKNLLSIFKNEPKAQEYIKNAAGLSPEEARAMEPPEELTEHLGENEMMRELFEVANTPGFEQIKKAMMKELEVEMVKKGMSPKEAKKFMKAMGNVDKMALVNKVFELIEQDEKMEKLSNEFGKTADMSDIINEIKRFVQIPQVAVFLQDKLTPKEMSALLA